LNEADWLDQMEQAGLDIEASEAKLRAVGAHVPERPALSGEIEDLEILQGHAAKARMMASIFCAPVTKSHAQPGATDRPKQTRAMSNHESNLSATMVAPATEKNYTRLCEEALAGKPAKGQDTDKPLNVTEKCLQARRKSEGIANE
jgi:hypothetical protein